MSIKINKVTKTIKITGKIVNIDSLRKLENLGYTIIITIK